MALSQIAHVRPSTPSAALGVMYGVPPLDLFNQNCAQNVTIRVKPDTTWQPQAKAKARVAHGRHVQHQFPAGLWQADTDEITHQKVWEKNYTVHLPTKEIDMLPSGDIHAYTDGSFMGGRSGAGAYILKKSEGKRTHFCSLRGNTKQATVFQSEVIAMKAAAEALIYNNPSICPLLCSFGRAEWDSPPTLAGVLYWGCQKSPLSGPSGRGADFGRKEFGKITLFTQTGLW
jgi:hypothetical protein